MVIYSSLVDIGCLVDHLLETRPVGIAVEFDVRLEQVQVAADAREHVLVFLIQQFAEGPLGRHVVEYGELVR